jgi:hypothetical protein
MAERLRLLLDTNILIPLEDSMVALSPNLANLIRYANAGGHGLFYHPASIEDVKRDLNADRRERTLSRLPQYQRLDDVPSSPHNTPVTSANDAADNDILNALKCSAVHALVSEDKGLHAKAAKLGLASDVYTIQTAEDWLRRLHGSLGVSLPNVEDLPLFSLTNQLDGTFFDSLRTGYADFDKWFRDKARTGRKAWTVRDEVGTVLAICIYAQQQAEAINDAGDLLPGLALKLCTFKVGDGVRGQKIGELFLKAAFQYATQNKCEHIFIHGDPEQIYLIELLIDFGFADAGCYSKDVVFVKEHPSLVPGIELPPVEFVKKYFPHFRDDIEIGKFLVPIQPHFHDTLFPELVNQLDFFGGGPTPGNAIKQAYLCHAATTKVRAGDIVLFYRTEDMQAITTVGVVESYEVHTEATSIMRRVSRRTVYNLADIEKMAIKPTKVMLFRLVKHFVNPVSYDDLIRARVVRGPIQSITKISEDGYSKIRELSG